MTIVCACGCGRTGPTTRGLARTCYDRARRLGTLARYPLLTADPAWRAHRTEHLARIVRDARLGRIEDYVDLREWGESRRAAAARLGVTRRTTVRWHSYLRAQGATYTWLPPMPAHLVAA